MVYNRRKNSIKTLSCYKQLLGREGIDEMIESIVSGRGLVEDHNWNRKKPLLCADGWRCELALLPGEGSTRPAQRVVAIEDLWGGYAGG